MAMTRITAALLALCAAAPLAFAGCSSQHPATIGQDRELPEPSAFVGGWADYHELAKQHSERAYAIESPSKKAYHFDMAVASFQRAKQLREETLAESPDLERPSIQADIDLIQRYLETIIRDRPIYTGPPYKPPSKRL